MPGLLPEAVAVLANMVESAVAAGGVGGERDREDHRLASGAGGDRVSAPVLAEAGARELSLDRASVRVGGRGRPAGLGSGAGSRSSTAIWGSPAGSATRRRGRGTRSWSRRVCLGEVGAIFGLEIARLARSNAESQRLLEFCGLTDTLVIDADGIYDLKNFNDRLLLGLKSQMSEAELHMITSRLQGAKRAAAERGELRFPLPVGYVRDDEGQTIIDPDEEVQAAIGDLFCAFAKTGSAYGVVGVFKGRRFPKRAYGGAWAGEVRWGALTHPRALAVLSNPCYAGAYVFGRYHSRRTVRPDGTITTNVTELPRAEWPVLIQDHHPGYITWERYLANERRLAANDTRGGRRPAREGAAICQGILRCGACGRSMTTRYQREGSYYECGHSRADHIATPGCRSVKTTVVDELIAGRVLAALAPREIALALAAADEVADRRARSTRAVELRVERARFEAIRAERAFHACEPENRLVARSLENRWETKLREFAEAEAELAKQNRPILEPSREELERLARDVPKLWDAETTARPRPQAAAALADRRRHPQLRARGPPARASGSAGARALPSSTRSSDRRRRRRETHPVRGDRDDKGLAAEHTEQTDRRAAQRHRAARRHRSPVRREGHQWMRWRHKIPPDDLAARRRADRQPDRRAPQGLRRHGLRLDRNRPPRRPPRTRQPALHPVPARSRATMPPSCRELGPPTGRNQNQGCRRCSLMPPSR